MDRPVLTPQHLGSQGSRTPLKLDQAYDAQEVMRLSHALSASDLRAQNDAAQQNLTTINHAAQDKPIASLRGKAVLARRGVIGNLLSASFDSTQASVFYGVPEAVLRNAGMNTLANIVGQGRLKHEHAAETQLSYARDHQGAVTDWSDVQGPWSFTKYTGNLLVQSVLPMGAAIAGSAAGAASGPALGATTALGLFGARAVGTTLSLYPFSLGANLDAQRGGGTHIGTAATLAVPHAAISSLLGPLAAVSGLTRAAGRAGLPAPSGTVDAMLLTGTGGAISQAGQGLIERSGVNRQNEAFWSPAFLDDLENRARDGALLFFLGPLGRPSSAVNIAKSRTREQYLAQPAWNEGAYFKAYLEGDHVVLAGKDVIVVGDQLIKITPAQVKALALHRMEEQNTVARALPDGTVPYIETIGDGLLRHRLFRGDPFKDLPADINTRTSALTRRLDLMAPARKAIGIKDTLKPYKVISSGPLKGWVVRIDTGEHNFLYAPNISVKWFDPVKIYPQIINSHIGHPPETL